MSENEGLRYIEFQAFMESLNETVIVPENYHRFLPFRIEVSYQPRRIVYRGSTNSIISIRSTTNIEFKFNDVSVVFLHSDGREIEESFGKVDLPPKGFQILKKTREFPPTIYGEEVAHVFVRFSKVRFRIRERISGKSSRRRAAVDSSFAIITPPTFAGRPIIATSGCRPRSRSRSSCGLSRTCSTTTSTRWF